MTARNQHYTSRENWRPVHLSGGNLPKQALMMSGEHGPIVVPGHPEKSKLIMYVDGEKQPRMPIKKPPLSKANIELLKSWIAAGARS